MTAPSPAPRAYATYFDSGYLSRGLTLIDSLRRHGDEAPIWILTLDDAAKQYLDDAALPHVMTLTIADIEAAEPTLLPLKTQRSRMEYYFTATPLLMKWVMARQSDPETVVIYLDADLYFFDDPSRVLDALGTGSVGIIEHKYPPRTQKTLAKYGRYNVGWVGIRCDEPGWACARWWGDSTLAWCSDKPDAGRYADQGYLNAFPDRFEGVVVLPSLGFNLAPWNTAKVAVMTSADSVTVSDGDRRDALVFFHFHGLRRVKRWYVSSQLVYGARMSHGLREAVYRPYAARLARADAVVAAAIPPSAVQHRGNGIRGLVSRFRKFALDRVSIATGNAVKVDSR
ncbi:MAG: hypothetical protein HIU88_09275 [Acidobacteria bacterium]|nr:hypothetical protein [Acidobacteriota bacterium]